VQGRSQVQNVTVLHSVFSDLYVWDAELRGLFGNKKKEILNPLK
jgi:hypothetical protein